jgi:heme-degrading monooxygenase HmoA
MAHGKIAQAMSFAAVFLYDVDPGGHDAFAAVYGPDGEWARFFAPGDGYLGTELLRSGDRYVLIDRWSTRAAYEAFLAANADEYAVRSERATHLWRGEEDLGRFDSA